jgi:glycolate oxidase FAD binding subunit
MDPKSLEAVLDAKAILTEADRMQAYAIDGVAPQAVVKPSTLDEAADVIKLANRDGFTVAIRGGGTKSSIGGLLKQTDVVLATHRLDKIIDMDTANLTVTAQAGVLFDDLQDLLMGLENRCYFPLDSDLSETASYMCSDREYKGAFMPLDPPLSSKATMGGIVASNSTGPMRTRYRPMRDLILGVRFISPKGDIIGMGGKTVKNVSGYDVSKLMIGSQGCLGVVGEMTIRLLPLPEETGGLLVTFADVGQAKAFVTTLINSKLLPTAVEVLNPTALKLTTMVDVAVPGKGLVVAIGQAGVAEEVSREIADIKAMAKQENAAGVTQLNAEDAAAFWHSLGDNCLSQAAVRLKANYVFSGYGAFMDQAAKAGEGCAFCVSAGSAVSQISFLDGATSQATALGEQLRAKAIELKGALVVEAGPPDFKQSFDVWGPPRGDFALMKHIKTELDPKGVLNPGRFVGGI